MRTNEKKFTVKDINFDDSIHPNVPIVSKAQPVLIFGILIFLNVISISILLLNRYILNIL